MIHSLTALPATRHADEIIALTLRDAARVKAALQCAIARCGVDEHRQLTLLAGALAPVAKAIDEFESVDGGE